MSTIITKTDQKMAAKVAAVSATDPKRAAVLEKARAFKRSWLDLAEALAEVDQKELWQAWGYDSVMSYAKSELHLRASTAQKLLSSFRFLKGSAPTVIEKARRKSTEPVPSLQAVDFVARANDRGAASPEVIEQIAKEAFEEGASAAALSRKFKEVAFPRPPEKVKQALRDQTARAAKRLVALLAHPDSDVSHDVASDVEASVGRLLSEIDAMKNAN